MAAPLAGSHAAQRIHAPHPPPACPKPSSFLPPLRRPPPRSLSALPLALMPPVKTPPPGKLDFSVQVIAAARPTTRCSSRVLRSISSTGNSRHRVQPHGEPRRPLQHGRRVVRHIRPRLHCQGC